MMGGGRDMDVTHQEEHQPDLDGMRFEQDVADLRARGLPFPDPAHPAVSVDRLDMEALWQALTDADRERIGVLALGIIVGGTIATFSETTAPAAYRAGVDHYHECLEELCHGEDGNPMAVDLALRGSSWKLPASIGPICLTCSCSESHACVDGHGQACAWADEAQTLCTHCQNPPPIPEIPF